MFHNSYKNNKGQPHGIPLWFGVCLMYLDLREGDIWVKLCGLVMFVLSKQEDKKVLP